MSNNEHADLEFEAMRTIHDALVGLDDDARSRVISYVTSRLGIREEPFSTKAATVKSDKAETADKPANVPTQYSSMAELNDAASPKTQADRALIAGYWLQTCQGNESFDSQSANSELKNLGHGLPNVTAALTKLIEHQPALVLQLKKSGSSQQARKTYKITVAGERAVMSMIKKQTSEE